MAKPSTLPVWATSGAIKVPIAAKQALGWKSDEMPPPQYFNWWQNLAYLWHKFIDDTWTDDGYRIAEETLLLGASSGESNSTGAGWQFLASVASTANTWQGPGSGDLVAFSIPLKIGDRIKSVHAFVQDTTGSHTVSMQLRKSDSSNNNTQIGSTQTSAGDGSNQTLSITGLTSTIADGEFYTILVNSDDATTTTHKVYGVKVVYDHP